MDDLDQLVELMTDDPTPAHVKARIATAIIDAILEDDDDPSS